MRKRRSNASVQKAETPVERPEIYRYHDHLAFLKDWLAYRKASQPSFSLRTLSNQTGLAVGLLPMILSGTRSLSSKVLAKLAPALGLTHSERAYFDILVILGTTDSQDVRLDALERMKRFRQYQKNNPKEAEVYQYLTHWYYVAIREMIALADFKLDPEWIQSRLRFLVPLAEIKEAIQFLVQNKYIETAPDGSIRPPEKEIDCNGGVYRIALTQFHREMFSLAATSIENTPREERSLMGHTVALNPADLEKAKQIIQDAIEQIKSLGNSKNESDSVYHMELALFPLTQRLKK